MVKIDSKKYYEMEFEKSQGLGSRFLIWKHEDVCTISISSLKVMCEKV
jgi:hypothetical protein